METGYDNRGHVMNREHFIVYSKPDDGNFHEDVHDEKRNVVWFDGNRLFSIIPNLIDGYSCVPFPGKMEERLKYESCPYFSKINITLENFVKELAKYES